MMHAKFDSGEVTSIDSSSSPRSPKRAVYYVQSPSHDSHDGDKSSSLHATPIYSSPTESPSYLSYGRHSLASSASRFSGPFRSSCSSSGRKGSSRKRSDKKWAQCDMIEEGRKFSDFYGEQDFHQHCHCLIALLGSAGLFTLFCLIIWGASRPYTAEVRVKNMTVNTFYFGEGSDFSGVPTKMLTVNCSLKMNIYNPATFFGIHVTSSPLNLIYSNIKVATGQVKKYYQPRKSRRTLLVNVNGAMVPLYGAGPSLEVANKNGEVPLMLQFEVRSRANVVGKLVRTEHRRLISCKLIINSHNTKPRTFWDDSCKYN